MLDGDSSTRFVRYRRLRQAELRGEEDDRHARLVERKRDQWETKFTVSPPHWRPLPITCSRFALHGHQELQQKYVKMQKEVEEMLGSI